MCMPRRLCPRARLPAWSRPPVADAAPSPSGYSLQGGAVGRGVQWMGVVLCNTTRIKHHINHYTLFPLHPPLMNLDPHRRKPSRKQPRVQSSTPFCTSKRSCKL